MKDGDGMTESMKAAARNVECVEDRPELVFHDFVARWWPAVPGGEKKSFRIGFPFLLVLAENGRERVGQRDRRGADLALCGLDLPVPRGAANMNASVIEVDVRPLEAENFACPHPCQGEDNEQRAPWLLGQVEDGLDLRMCKVRGDVAIALWQNQLSQFNFHSGIAPVISCGEHRGERAQNVQHGFPRCAF